MLICPRCGDRNEGRGPDIRCSQCSASWEIDDDGVVRLGGSTPLRDVGGEAEVAHLVEELRLLSPGQLDAELERLEQRYDGFGYRQCLNPALADWTLLGDFHGRRVLDVASGFGGIPLALAQTADSIVALDTNVKKMQVLANLARIEQADNITPVHGGIDAMAEAAGGYDRAILAGQLGNSGRFFANGSRAHNQIRLLRRIHQLLADEGEIWIATDNRFSPLRFDPRAIAGGDWRGLPSERGLRRLLKQSGFVDQEYFYAVADYRYPLFISTSGDDRVVSNYVNRVRQGTSTRSRLGVGLISLADRLGAVGPFSPALLVRATKR